MDLPTPSMSKVFIYPSPWSCAHCSQRPRTTSLSPALPWKYSSSMRLSASTPMSLSYPSQPSQLPLPNAPVTPPKRKSTFLHTLSRLSARKSTAVSPKAEINDPLASSPSATSTGLAAYFTAIANSPVLRHTRAWKRFVRVRPDDLESVRPEKAIKRVRSDLAAHLHDVHPPLQDTVAPEDSLPTPVQSPKDLDHTLSDPISRHEVKKSQGDCPRQLFASPILNVLYRLHSASYST